MRLVLCMKEREETEEGEKITREWEPEKGCNEVAA